MRLVLISDTHGLHRDLPPLPEGDILIHAGDFMRSGRSADEVLDFADWMAEQSFKDKLVIAGNHDMLMQTSIGIRAAGWFGKRAVLYLEDSGVVFQDSGVKFYGSPWTPRFQHWAFMSDRGPEMARHWDLIPSDTSVLITHGPPQGVLDSAPSFGADLGCADLRAAVLRLQPKLLVFGHIHFAGGQQTSLGSTLCVNASLLDDGYRIAHSPVVVDI